MTDNKELLNLIKLIPGGASLYDVDFRILNISDFALLKTGKSRCELVGLHAYDLVHASDRERVKLLLEKLEYTTTSDVYLHRQIPNRFNVQHFTVEPSYVTELSTSHIPSTIHPKGITLSDRKAKANHFKKKK